MLGRSEMAAVKRTAQNLKNRYAKKEKLESKIESFQKELDLLNKEIEQWELPIITMSGGYTSAQILAGKMEEEVTKITTEDNTYPEEEITEGSNNLQEDNQLKPIDPFAAFSL